eukprot:scaffold209697_cov42-Prasinocladus_malaysianus.AAC.2
MDCQGHGSPLIAMCILPMDLVKATIGILNDGYSTKTRMPGMALQARGNHLHICTTHIAGAHNV